MKGIVRSLRVSWTNISSIVLLRAELIQQRAQVVAAVSQLDSQLAAATAEVTAVRQRTGQLQQQANTLAMEAQQRRNDQGLLESQVLCEVFILALKVTFYLGFVWDLQTPPASKGCACITALSSSGWISSNQITGWISFSLFMILLET